MLFYGTDHILSTIDDAAVVRAAYQQTREVVERFCPAGVVRTQAVQALEASLLGAVLAIRLGEGKR